MKLFKRIGCFFDRIGHDIRLFNPKPSLIIGAVALCLGVLSWVMGGRGDKALLVYIFPRSAFPLGAMYLLWALSFVFVGIVIGGMLLGCEKYKRKEAIKAVIFLTMSLLFTLFIHPVFFKAMAPFIAFMLVLIALTLCLLALLASARLYSLWTIMLGVHLLWLTYNLYILFCIALIN